MYTCSRVCLMYQGGKLGGPQPNIPGLKSPSAYTDGHVPKKGALQLPACYGPSSAQGLCLWIFGWEPPDVPPNSNLSTPDQAPMCTWAAPPPPSTLSSDLAWIVEDAARKALSN